MLIVPSLVNKYYLTDLSPGRSLVEYAVKHGCQVFHISWVNPDVSDRDFDLDTYVAGDRRGARRRARDHRLRAGAHASACARAASC